MASQCPFRRLNLFLVEKRPSARARSDHFLIVLLLIPARGMSLAWLGHAMPSASAKEASACSSVCSLRGAAVC